MSETTKTAEPASPLKKEWKKMFNYKWIVSNIPFFLFLACLAVLYIYNGHMADKLARKIAASEKNIKELEYEYKSVKAEVIYRSKASELVKAVEALGLRESKQPPVVLRPAAAK
ncbi:MAG: hypothetical protein EOO03_05110 [Chitinophagaceae bacterium]|nr:MAG: hypothetical protein EOO03_05110 [Chitinophagaceae bacterium]